MIQLSEPSQLQQLTTAQIEKEQRRGVLILDTRPGEQFASFHLPGSIQIGLMGPFASWAAILIKPTQELLLIAEDANCAHEAQIRLARVGLRNVIGYALADENLWRQEQIKLTSLPVGGCEDVCRARRENQPLQLVDVRSWPEWLKAHLPGAISMPLLEFNARAASIDPSLPGLVYCEEGYRSTTAASMLLRSNVRNIGVLVDGMDGWRSRGLPMETSAPNLMEPFAALADVSK
jgi:rhodanese-related sulfurtransferase